MARIKPFVTIRGGEFCIESRPQPCGVVIFGASGDLTARKLLPALYRLFERRLVSKKFYVIGAGRTPMTDAQFREHAGAALNKFVKNIDETTLKLFLQLCYYCHGDYDGEELYQTQRQRFNELDAKHGTGGNHLFYLSLPPNLYGPVAARLNAAGLAAEDDDRGQWARVIIEKPFGRDLNSALELDRQLHKALAERQIYRIDHYLGKETVQNILMFRFANAIFEPVWNSHYIDHVKITAAESIGVGHRAGYFEQAGVLRDMFQNHMMQMLAMVAMEPPASADADRIRDEKVKVLQAIRPIPLDELDEWVVRGQYEAGEQDGEPVKAYREEPGVAADSMTETFVAAKLMVDNWRWNGVPFYLRSGKRLGRRYSEIAVTFKPVPHSIFSPIKAEELTPNVLVFNVQPDEGISLTMQAKHPGPKLCMSGLNMDFLYSDVFGEEPGEAYERLLLDGMLGDQTLFVRHDDMEAAWRLYTPVLDRWAEQGSKGTLHLYEPGWWGPKASAEMLHKEGRYWRNPVMRDGAVATSKPAPPIEGDETAEAAPGQQK